MKKQSGLWKKFWPPKAGAEGEPAAELAESTQNLTSEDTLKPDWDTELPPGDHDSTAKPLEVHPCPICHTPLTSVATYCTECGFVVGATQAAGLKFSSHEAVRDLADGSGRALTPAPTWHERFLPKQSLPSRPEVQRWLAEARQEENRPTVEVYYSLTKPDSDPNAIPEDQEDTVNLQAPLDPPSTPSSQLLLSEGRYWPGAKWLHYVLKHVTENVPEVIEYQELGEEEILVLQPPKGTSLWDAWENNETPLRQRFTWLRQIAELLVRLHEQQVMVEALRPEMFVVTDDHRVVLSDLSELLPLPIPPGALLKGALSTAPELVLAPELIDARADLYPFGALIYALHHGRELAELDFDAYGVPRSFVTVFPDGHPLFTRIVLKTFTRHVGGRFPTSEDDADKTGFRELIEQLKAGEAAAGALRLDISGWSSTGVVRSDNEDAFGIFHSSLGGRERWDDQALVILTDGMGGCNAGEVASALAIAQIRESLIAKAPFSNLIESVPHGSGDSAANDTPLAKERTPLTCTESLLSLSLGEDQQSANGPSAQHPPLSKEHLQNELHSAIQQANRAIHAAAEQGDGGQVGMGCTCEAAWIAQGHLTLGHVGDSRTYLFRQGHIKQLTRDQTMVNRMVALGVISEEEALDHPRKHELEQAIGSSHPLEVQMISEPLYAGDVLVFCSDGLTNHVNDRNMAEIIRNTHSAESAARRLVNHANALGGSDNVTVVVARVS